MQYFFRELRIKLWHLEYSFEILFNFNYQHLICVSYNNILSVLLLRLGGCAQQRAVGVRGGGVERQPVLCTMDYLEG